jgi:class 3 adenylate cyclase
MSQVPTGTVTFLFTDIEGSTQRWDKHSDAIRVALAAERDAGLPEIRNYDDGMRLALATASAEPA